MSEKRDEIREDRFTWNPGDVELVNIGDGPPLSKVLEERKRQQEEDRKWHWWNSIKNNFRTIRK
jgi:hypothetical protein